MKKKFIISSIIALVAIFLIAIPVYAIALPDSDPTIEGIDIYRNCLEPDDYFMLIYENTPYATTPNMSYEDAFTWDMYCTSNTTMLSTTTGYYFHEKGYGYNVIGFYFSADEAPTWESLYHIRLVGTAAAFGSPPTYNYQVDNSDYSTLTDTDEVKDAIAVRVIEIAEDLNVRWELTSIEYLTVGGVGENALSLMGESFFRGAIYGIQSLAPDAFSVDINNITSTDRTWTDNYSTALGDQYAGTYIETAYDSGNTMLDVDFNLMGLLIIFGICGAIFAACIYVGGDVWGSAVVIAGPLVIGGRLAMIGLGELGFIAALSWLFVSGKVWKIF